MITQSNLQTRSWYEIKDIPLHATRKVTVDGVVHEVIHFAVEMLLLDSISIRLVICRPLMNGVVHTLEITLSKTRKVISPANDDMGRSIPFDPYGRKWDYSYVSRSPIYYSHAGIVNGTTDIGGHQIPFTPSTTTDTNVTEREVYQELMQPEKVQMMLLDNVPHYYMQYEDHLDRFFARPPQ